MPSSDQLLQLGEVELRTLAQELTARLSNAGSELQTKDRRLVWSTARTEQLTYEIAVLERWKFSARSEQLDAAQKSLLDEEVDADTAAVELELDSLRSTPRPAERQQPRRAPLPPHLPRTVLHHERENTTCACGCALKRFGPDISEKLDYTPGVFTVERHIRGKWACARCQSLVQAPVPAQVMDRGLPTAGPLAQHCRLTSSSR
jgi:transposase